ncbi:hypothetical protein GCM10010124_26720 [Pilimelia terevasa]|uniref:Uncharacterized protein n=1 Tax=Pilimelia terevasa TaxID=53372 RepID=A0A8J3BMT4_9ACTN|nr:hypothetical protein [Pilimelia terevasa]GGK32625.1 hypothetical protein GCM10010124_26720 [Pilimelia terevasa]
MNVFSRTFLPAAREAGLAVSTVSRHLPVLRQCVGPGDAVSLVARCFRPERPQREDFLLLLTRRRLVVTRQGWPLSRLRLHLNAELRHLRHVSWTADPRNGVIELAATAVDGVRERFCTRVPQPHQLWRLDDLFTQVFRGEAAAAARRPVLAHAVAAETALAGHRDLVPRGFRTLAPA